MNFTRTWNTTKVKANNRHIHITNDIGTMFKLLVSKSKFMQSFMENKKTWIKKFDLFSAEWWKICLKFAKSFQAGRTLKLIEVQEETKARFNSHQDCVWNKKSINETDSFNLCKVQFVIKTYSAEPCGAKRLERNWKLWPLIRSINLRTARYLGTLLSLFDYNFHDRHCASIWSALMDSRSCKTCEHKIW